MQRTDEMSPSSQYAPTITNPTSVFLGLPRLLSWDDEEEIIDALDQRYVKQISMALALGIEKLEATERFQGKELSDKIDQLSDAAFLRLLTAPEMCSALAGMSSQPVESLRHFLTDAIQAEESRLSNTLARRGGTWTALGDCYISEHPPFQLEDLFGQIGDYCFQGPHIGKIPVDLGCPTKPLY